MKFILQREVDKPCDQNHDCDNCRTHVCCDIMLVATEVSQEEYIAALLKVIDECESECELVGDDLQGEIWALNYMRKADFQLHDIKSGKYPDSTFKFTI